MTHYKILLITICLLFLGAGCSEPPYQLDPNSSGGKVEGENEEMNLGTQEAILGDIDLSVIPVNKIQTSIGEVKVEYTDENENETFIIKTNREQYGGNNNYDVILSVTNLRNDEWGSITLKSSSGQEINSIGKYIPVESTREIPVYSDVEVVGATTTEFVRMQTGTTTEEYNKDTWKNIDLRDIVIKNNILVKETVGTYDKKEARYLFPKGTTFFKLNINYKDSLGFKDEFFLEVFGDDGGYGMLDPIVDSLLAYYNFDEASGVRYDSTANDEDLADTTTVPSGTGIINNGIAGDETEYLTSQSAINFPIEDDPRTFSFWYYVDANETAASNIFQYGTLALNESQHATIQPGAPGFIAYGGYATDLDVSIGISKETWYHFVFTFDGTDAKIYMDGNSTPVGTRDASTWFTGSGSTLYVGAQGGVSYHFYGVIDEFGAWARVLSTDEIAELYNSGDGLSYPFEEAVVAIPDLNQSQILEG